MLSLDTGVRTPSRTRTERASSSSSLHLSKEEQRKRFLARLDEPDKNWKFNEAIPASRSAQCWDDYMEAVRNVPLEDQHAKCAVVPHLYLNRELGQLAFTRRVLAQAENRSYPLLERLKFLCIVSSNLDEFFEIRVAGPARRDRSGVAAGRSRPHAARSRFRTGGRGGARARLGPVSVAQQRAPAAARSRRYPFPAARRFHAASRPRGSRTTSCAK